MVAIPVSFMMFFVKTGCCPSPAIKSPRVTSFSRSVLGSNWIVSGAEAMSVPPSTSTDTITWLDNLAPPRARETTTRAAPPDGAGDVSIDFGASTPGGGGAVAGEASGGAWAGGAVAGGAVAGGLMAGAVTPGVFTAEPAAGGCPEGSGVGAAGCKTAAAAAGPLTTSVGFGE